MYLLTYEVIELEIEENKYVGIDMDNCVMIRTLEISGVHEICKVTCHVKWHRCINHSLDNYLKKI